jgi:hypothetical protein
VTGSGRTSLIVSAVAAVLTVLVADGAAQPSRTGAKPQSTAKSSALPVTDDQAKLRQALVQSAIGAANTPLGDYVQCRFTVGELFELRLSPDVVALTKADSEEIKKAVISAALSANSGNVVNEAVTNKFVELIGDTDFDGKTQSQAVTTILKKLEDARQGSKNEQLAAVRGKWPTASENLDQQNKLFALSDLTPAKAQDLSSSAKTPEEKEVANALVSAPANILEQTTKVANVARQQASAFIRPPDVGCAMSILTFDETKRAYGSFVAQAYIGVQIVVRNLNPNQEFQVHDAQFATDLDPSGRHARFFSGRDKLIVRSFSVAQQSFDARNLAVHSSQAVGAILSAISPVYGGPFADAVGVLTGAAIPGLDKTWKDLSIDQLNLLNDTGLSSSVNSRTTVPKSGVAMFVTFVPSKLYENAWWTQSCANKTYVGSLDSGGKTIRTGKDSGQVGVDIDRALEPCLSRPITSGSTGGSGNANGSSGESETYKVNLASSGADRSQDIFFNSKGKSYKNWTGNMLSIFNELSFAVISGAHIVAETDLLPNLATIDCPHDDTGEVKFDGKDSLVCSINGANLEKIKKIRLRNKAKQAESLDGAVSPGQKNVSFAEKDMALLSGTTYTVLFVDNADKETETTLALSLPTDPRIAAIEPNIVDMGALPLPTIKVSGAHLKNVKTFILTEQGAGGKSFSPIAAENAADSSFTIALDEKGPLSQIDGTKQAVIFTVSLSTSSAGADPAATPFTLSFKNKIKGATPPALDVTLDKKTLDLSSKQPFLITIKGEGLKDYISVVLESKTPKLAEVFKLQTPTDTSLTFAIPASSKFAKLDASKAALSCTLSLSKTIDGANPVPTKGTLSITGKLPTAQSPKKN